MSGDRPTNGREHVFVVGDQAFGALLQTGIKIGEDGPDKPLRFLAGIVHHEADDCPKHLEQLDFGVHRHRTQMSIAVPRPVRPGDLG